MYEDDSLWLRPDATLTDEAARREFGLTQPEIYTAIQAGMLRFQIGEGRFGPCLCLLRHEVENLVNQKNTAGTPPPNRQVLELTLGEMGEVFINVMAGFAFDTHSDSGQDNLEPYQKLLEWINRRNRPLTSDNQAQAYSLITSMKQELQSLLRNSSQKFQQIDIPNSLWLFLAFMMRKDGKDCHEFLRICERGWLYESVATRARSTRDKVKEMLTRRALFADNDAPCQGSRVKRAFDELFPDAANYIFDAKQPHERFKPGGIAWSPEFSDGRKLANGLRMAETNFMVDRVYSKLRQEGEVAFAARVCDCMIFRPLDGERVKAVMVEEFNKESSQPDLRIEDV